MPRIKANIVWGLLLFLIFLRPFICQMCDPTLDIYYSLVFLLCSLLWLIFTPKTSFKSPLNLPIIIFCVALIISTIFSINFSASLKQIYKFLPCFAVFYLMGQVTVRQRRQVLICLISAGLILSLRGIYQFFWGYQYLLDYLNRIGPYPYAQEFMGRKRVLASFLSPNMFAGYLIMIIPIACALFLDSFSQKKRRLSVFTGLSIFLMLLALLLTKSIGGGLSFLVGFLAFGLLLFIHFPHLRSKVIWTTGIFSIIIIIALAGIFSIRAAHIFHPGNQQNSFLQRFYFWQSTVKAIKDFPLIGIGLGNFARIYPRYKIPGAIETQFAHNSYLQIWLEIGITGIVAWLWLAICSFQAGLKTLTAEKSYLLIGLLSASCAFLAHNLIDFSFFVPEVALYWWLILQTNISQLTDFT